MYAISRLLKSTHPYFLGKILIQIMPIDQAAAGTLIAKQGAEQEGFDKG